MRAPPPIRPQPAEQRRLIFRRPASQPNPTRRRFLRWSLLSGVLVWDGPKLLAQVAGQAGASPGSEPSGSLLHNTAAWARFRADMARRPDSLAVLIRDADRWMDGEMISIVHKKHPAPSGDPHDYVSLAPYSWPDPRKSDGLPWINRDGEVNPAFYEYDNPVLENLCHAVPWLVLRAQATGSLPHARRAGRLLRAWFLDTDTRMNPHLRFAQIRPGVHNGSATGIIDTTSLVFLADAATRLQFNEEWTPQHLSSVKGWFSRYLDWLLTSDSGRKEAGARNNHGTWYDAQVASFASFCDRPDIARQQIEKTTLKRIADQIEPDGRQPGELRRTLALTYCTYNLLAFASLARMAAPLGVDLWRWQSQDGRGLLPALRWLLPYYAKERAWAHKQIKPFEFSNAALLLNLAWECTGDGAFARLCGQVEEHPWQRITFSKASLAVRKIVGPD